MKLLLTSLFLLAFIVYAGAQQMQVNGADPEALKKGLQVMQSQRNFALDMQANAEVKALTLAEENEKLKARVSELEARLGTVGQK